MPSLVECSFTSTETVGFLGTGAQDGHLDFHTAPELCSYAHGSYLLHTNGYPVEERSVQYTDTKSVDKVRCYCVSTYTSVKTVSRRNCETATTIDRNIVCFKSLLYGALQQTHCDLFASDSE